MARKYTTDDLRAWDERIREKVEELGLRCYPQEFELCDHAPMLSAMAYHGMPAHYPHWSYGKAYERLKTLYDYGVTGLPYEMVINSNPCLAYLMHENSLCLQVLTIAHVYGHNDFFRNNFTFRHTQPDKVIAAFKARADRVRSYIEDPSIGLERVETVLDAAHALSLQCRRNPAIRKLSRDEQVERVARSAEPPTDPFRAIHRRPDYAEPDLTKVPLEPEEDILLFIRDHNPYLGDWEKDLLTIVHDEAQYFIPQIETKIMNEGWASYWHREIMNGLDLPQDIHMEFLVRHNQVVRPLPGDLNPYHVGFMIWEDIRRRYDEPKPEEVEERGPPAKSGRDKMFEVREVDRDVSFLRRHLTEELVRKLRLFEYVPKDDKLVVTRVASREDWRDVKETLLRWVGMGNVPVIRIVDADRGRTGTLHLVHEHDGRDLHMEFAEMTLGHLRTLWGRPVALDTVVDGKPYTLHHRDDGFELEGRN